MKFKLSALLIVLSTAAIIGIINFALNKSIATDEPTSKKSDEVIAAPKQREMPKPKKVTGALDTPNKIATVKNDPRAHDMLAAHEEIDDSDDDEPLALDDQEMSPQDVEKINSIVALSESDLNRDLKAIKSKIDDDDIFGKLEEGQLSGQQEIDAKETLERFALLGLEVTRRKYMAVEPELKNPLLAYKDSLIEIREMLNDDFSDDE